MKNLALLSVTTLCAALLLSACGEKAASTAASPEQKAAPTAAAPAPAAQQAAASGEQTGKALHDANCISCHDSGVYTRADRKITSLEALAGQVRRCDANLGTQLFDEDMDKITAYLNETYYKFPAK